MRYTALIVTLFCTVSVSAADTQRNVVGKLTSSAKPEVRVMSTHERIAASENLLALNLDYSPDQVVCQKVRVGRDSASKLKVQRCKTRAEFREEAEDGLIKSSMMLDNSKYMAEVRRQIQQSTRRRIRVQKE